MEPDATTCRSRDILSRPTLALLVYCLPALAMVVAGALPISSLWRTVIWTAALVVMGAACTVNAARCGRVHCYLTGPFFLLMAVATLLYGWSLLGLITLVGAVVLCCLPEMLFGKYRPRRTAQSSH